MTAAISAYLQEVRARLKAATPGPWHEVDGERILVSLDQLPEGANGLLAEVGDPSAKEEMGRQTQTTNANATLIASAPADLKLLVECLERAVVSLKFACGDRCFEENPCDAKDALHDIAKLIAERVK